MTADGDRWRSGDFPEAELSPGFSRRVIRLAALERKRHGRRRFLATLGICMAISFASTMLVRELVSPGPALNRETAPKSAVRESTTAAHPEPKEHNVASEVGTVDETAPRGPIDYLFPDAQWPANSGFKYAGHAKQKTGTTDSSAFSAIIQHRCPECAANLVKRKPKIAESEAADTTVPQHQVSPALPIVHTEAPDVPRQPQEP
jgi:hypothetical protein